MRLRFEFDAIEDSKTKIVIKKTAFAAAIFIFETLVPWLAGLQMILALLMNAFIVTVLTLFRAMDAAEFFMTELSGTIAIGAVFIVLLHILYHIIIRGMFRTSLLIEMGIELFAVFLFFWLIDPLLKMLTHGNAADGIMSMARYMYLIAACLYAVMLIIVFAVKYLKYLKHKKHIKDKNLL
jgi:hypothetical protein